MFIFAQDYNYSTPLNRPSYNTNYHTNTSPIIICKSESLVATADVGAYCVLTDLLTIIHFLTFIHICKELQCLKYPEIHVIVHQINVCFTGYLRCLSFGVKITSGMGVIVLNGKVGSQKSHQPDH